MNVLILTSSAQGDASVSTRLATHFGEEIRAGNPGARIVLRDLGREPIPHLTPETVAGIRGDAVTGAEVAARDLSDRLLDEVRAADIVVIASGMYNFGISSTLKSWFDYLLRPRIAFRYTEAGPEGLLGERKVILIESRAGAYEGASDLQTEHLRMMLSFAGLSDITVVKAEGLAFNAEAAIAAASEKLSDLARQPLALAA